MMNSLTPPPAGWSPGNKRPRLSQMEVRREALRIFADFYRTAGLRPTLDQIRVEDLIRLHGLPRSTVYRIWPTKQKLVFDVACVLARPEPGPGAAFDPGTLEISSKIIERNRHRLSNAEGRRAVLLEAIRQGAERNFRALLESPTWRTHNALLGVLDSFEGEEHAQLLSALTETEESFITAMASFYDEMLLTLGFELRSGVTTRMVAALGASVVEGLMGRARTLPEIESMYITGPGLYSTAQWHPAAVGFLGVISALVDIGES